MDILSELEVLKEHHLYRFLRPMEGPQGPVVRIGDRSFLNFSSNDYLGLAFDPRLIEASERALERWGTSSGASRLLSGSLAIHHELEKAVAAFKREESTLVFSSGFMANLGAVGALVGPGDTVWLDRACHASMVDAARLSGARMRVFAHRDVEMLARWLKRTRARKQLILTESVFSMDGDIAPLEALQDAAKRFGAMLMVDEAHAMGVFGPSGRGVIEACRLEGKIDLVMGTFSKALGSQGGFLCGRSAFMELILNRARSFIYTTAPSPAASAASLEALRILEADPRPRQRLWQNVQFLRSKLKNSAFDLLNSEGPIIPILVGRTDLALDISEKLYERGILLPAIRPPTVPKGTDRLRISVSAKHTEEHLNELAEALHEIRE